ncbi:DUF3450 domain-containing protein [Puniceicoccaceae bacterium K14]|nr:DUF3450 domain-containing protein [Puniceicoccaceae bacterium K14]
MILSNRFITITAASLTLIGVPALKSEEPIKDSQMKLSEWISIEKQISEDKHRWAMEKEIMADSISLMKGEIEGLQKQIEEYEESASTTETKKAELNEQKEIYSEISDEVKALLSKYETSLRSLFPLFPAPLISQIKPLTSRMPEDSLDTDIPISSRLQNVVGILTAIDKFNGVVTKDTGIQDIGDGNTAEVTKLYFGLASAYFVDASGIYAGYGRPGTEGWDWTVDNDISDSVKGLVGVYEGTQEASFIAVPVKLDK